MRLNHQQPPPLRLKTAQSAPQLQQQKVKVDPVFDEELLGQILSNKADNNVLNHCIEKILIHIFKFQSKIGNILSSEDRKGMLLMLNYTHYVLGLEKYFPFYSQNLTEYHVDWEKYYSKKGTGMTASSSYTQDTLSAKRDSRQGKLKVTGVSEMNKKFEPGVFDWSGYFRSVENRSLQELEKPLWEYGMRKDTLGKF